MGLLNKLGNLFSSRDKEELKEKKTIFVSDNPDYQAQAKRHTAIHNKLVAKQNELDKLLNIKHAPLTNQHQQRQQSEEDIYSKNVLKQKAAQIPIKNSFYKLLNQRQIFTNVINKLNREWPEREPEVIDMIIESEKEIVNSEEIAKDRILISQGKDPSIKNDPLKMSRMYDIGDSKNKEKYKELFNEPIFSTKRKKNN